jgi:hypothetical protein
MNNSNLEKACRLGNTKLIEEILAEHPELIN